MHTSTVAEEIARIPVLDALALHGGPPVRTKPWPSYDKGDVFINEEDEQAALKAIRSHLYFRYDMRPFAETACGRFEKRIQDYFGVKHALACSSGTAAISLALMAAQIPKGARIACPGFTFAATPSAIILAGCKPHLVENDKNLHFDVDALRRDWHPEIKAIVVVHMRGLASDMAAITEFAREKDVPVIEDAVPAMGADIGGQKLGTFGLAGSFSTQSDKSINTGEGGFLTTNDTELFARATVLSGAFEGRLCRHMNEIGADTGWSDLDLPLFSMRMDEIRAALAEAQFDRLHIRLEDFKRNYDYVVSRLGGIPAITIRRPIAPRAYLGDSLVFRLKTLDPGLFVRALRREGIDARNLGADDDNNVRVFWNWRFMFPERDPGAIKAKLPNTARYLTQAIDIPLASTLTQADCDDLVYAVHKVVGGLAARS